MAETIKIGGELESTATGNVVAVASAIKDKVKNKYQGEINAETDASLADRYTKAETYNKTELNNMITTPNQEFVSVVATDQTTAVTDVLPATGEADTIYRVGNWDGTQYNDSVFSEYTWSGSAYIKLSTKSQVGEVYDISANHADTKYADLSAALGTNGANIPQSLRKGGMSVKFVQSSDNKYVQYFLTKNTWSININDWLLINNLDKISDTKMIDFPFTVRERYIDGTTGELKSNWDYISTTNIPVNEGDEFYYSGKSSNSMAVACYALENDNLVYKYRLVPKTITDTRLNVYVVIPAGVTHVIAVSLTADLASAKFSKVERSELSEIKEGLGDIISVSNKVSAINGHYVNKNGSWSSSNSAYYILFDVDAGDELKVYEYKVDNMNVSILSQKVSESSYKVLINPTSTGFINVEYQFEESMTACLSIYIFVPRMVIVKKNKMQTIDVSIANLNERQTQLEENNAWLEQREIQVGYIFDKVAVIGDSMACGTLEGATGFTFDSSWLSFLAKRWNCKGLFHYANSGSSTYLWLNNTMWGLRRFLSDIANNKIYNAYFIAYGHNDNMTVGEATDEAATVTITEGVPSCPSGLTFCAYYKAIINQIRANAPHAMIFCLSEYDDVMMGNAKSSYRQAVIDVADSYYNGGDKLVHHLETGGVPASGMGLVSHYSTIGYDYIAKRINDEVNKVIYEHRADNEIKLFGAYNLGTTENSPWENT